LFLQSINQIFAPTIAELHAKGEHDMLLRLYQTLTKWSLGLTIPLALGIMIFAKPLMGIFGRDFREGWPVLAIATIGQLVSCGVGSVGNLLIMSDQQKRFIRAQAIGVAVTVGLNFALIPRWGMTGAAIAVGASNACMNLLWLREVKRRMRLFPSKKGYASLLLPTAATLATLVGLRALLQFQLPDLVLIPLALIAAYAAFALVAMLFALDQQDKVLAVDAYTRLRARFIE
jgi:O-antigen/teichoic acid export membrane protein